MSKKRQFRCEECKRRLFSWEEGSKFIEDQAEGLEYQIIDGTLFVKCTKCETINYMTPEGLRVVEKEVEVGK